MANTLHLLAAVSCLSLAAAYWGPDLPPGPYCGRTNECCSDRRDSCAHRILDTLCYCDQFCNHTASHDDCCPDYPEVCLGRRPEEVPVPLKQPCRHRGQLFMPGAVRMEDCNSCECVEGQDGLTTWVCQSDPCLVSGEVLARVHQRGGSWRAYNYTQFQGKKLKDGLVYYLGTLPLSRETQRMGAIRYNKEPDYPAHFDSRSRWPRYISPARDQGWCGADWAVTLADVVSDRFAIQSNGAETLALSPQVFLSCNRRGQQGCRGGHIDVAWSFAKSHGLVDEECLPYVANVTRCPFRPRHDLVQDGCRIRNPQRTSRYKVGPPSRLKREEDIMYDIMESGPVQAILTVHQDFFHYRDGIYRRSHFGDNKLQGLHAVRIVGWGEDQGDKYWIVANSWGPEWGENGFFRIARGVNESGIESFVVTVLVEVIEANRRK